MSTAGKAKGMRPQSAKAKGRRLQQFVARELVALFPGVLDFDDCRSTSMGAAGDDVLLSPLAQRIIPCDFECKNVENLPIWAALKQASARRKDRRIPTVVAGRNRRKPVVVVPFGWLFNTVERQTQFSDTIGSGGMAFGPSLRDKLHCLVQFNDDRWRGKSVKVVETKAMKFWPTVDRGDHEIIIFNRGDPIHTVWSVISWQMFLHVLRKHAETRAARWIVPPASPEPNAVVDVQLLEATVVAPALEAAVVAPALAAEHAVAPGSGDRVGASV